MKSFDYRQVNLTDGYLASKEELNRKITINAVYDRFYDSGRITAFKFTNKDVHYFWDSDVAKWMEGAAYILAKHPDAALQAKVEELIDDIAAHQGADGYFNIYFTVREPDKRFTNRDCHELYCAGHLFEAAVAYAEATGREKFLRCMEKYADYIYKVFVEEHSAAFVTPGHEEIELALVKMYRYTKKKKYLDLFSDVPVRLGNSEIDVLNTNNEPEAIADYMAENSTSIEAKDQMAAAYTIDPLEELEVTVDNNTSKGNADMLAAHLMVLGSQLEFVYEGEEAEDDEDFITIPVDDTDEDSEDEEETSIDDFEEDE